MMTGERYLGKTILVREDQDRPGTFLVEIDGRLLVTPKAIKTRTEGIMRARAAIAQGRCP